MTEPRYYASAANEDIEHGCCYDAVVIDRQAPIFNYEKTEVLRFQRICECFNMTDAELIANALNGRAQ